jgi:hypothetical protein
LEILGIRSNSIKFQSNLRARYKKIYYLDIRDIIKYHEKIGFTHPKKKFLLGKYVRALKKRRKKKLLKS